MKRMLALLIIMLLFCLISSSCAGCFDTENGDAFVISSEIPPVSVELASKPLESLSGTVVDASIHTVTIQTDKGDEITFQKDEDTLVNGSGLAVGAVVTLSFYGDAGAKETQRDVHAAKINVVSGAPAQSSPTGARAQQLLDEMTLEEKVGQMFLVCCPERDATGFVEKYQVGGFVLFGRDFKGKTKAEVIDNIASYQAKSKLKMLICVDEEGGTVNRVSAYSEFRAIPFLSPQQLYEKGGMKLIKSDTEEKAGLLKTLGINCNLAPVCDVSIEPDDFIYARSFGKGGDATSEYVKTVVTVMQQQNLGCTLKHFPGYGGNADTHAGIVHDKRPYSTFLNSDFKPFQAGLEAGAGSVLVSHNIVESMDPDYPASLSGKVHQILREELSFDGVVMTDDLAMGAVSQYTDGADAAVLAVEAGNDMLCTSGFDEGFPAVLNAVREGRILETQIDKSVHRILVWKLNLKILE